MPTHDLLTRIAAAVSLLATVYNLFLTLVFFAVFIWVAVGLCWSLVAVVLLLEGVVAIALLITGYRPWGFAVPILGVICSLCNFNFIGVILEVVSLILLAAAASQANTAQNERIG